MWGGKLQLWTSSRVLAPVRVPNLDPLSYAQSRCIAGKQLSPFQKLMCASEQVHWHGQLHAVSFSTCIHAAVNVQCLSHDLRYVANCSAT